MILIKTKGCKNKSDAVCAVCDHDESEEIYAYHFNKRMYSIRECVFCSHMFADPIPLVDVDERKMEGIEDAELFNHHLKYLHEKFIINREIKSVKKLLPKENLTLLDIGCGTGWTTSIWREHMFEVTGLEPSSERAKVATEKYNIPIIQEHVESFEPSIQYDVIVLRHALEHIKKPAVILDKIRSWLSAEGVLIVTVPNINSIGRYLFREHWEWVLPWHLHFFQPNTLVTLAQKAGFQKAHFYQTPSPLWYPASFGRIFKEGSKLRQYFCQAPNLVKLLPFFPLVLMGYILNLNDNMTLFLKKSA